jgi:CrcB protein
MKKTLYVAAFGALGALSRYLIADSASAHLSGALIHLPVLLINLSGSFMLGMLLCLFMHRPSEGGGHIRTGVTVGFLGGFTTFSTFCRGAVSLYLADGFIYSAAYVATDAALRRGGRLVRRHGSGEHHKRGGKMNAMSLVALGGAAGAALRYWIGNYMLRHEKSGFPYGTLLVNILGAFLLGLFRYCRCRAGRDYCSGTALRRVHDLFGLRGGRGLARDAEGTDKGGGLYAIVGPRSASRIISWGMPWARFSPDGWQKRAAVI